jgi:hypothetical protein
MVVLPVPIMVFPPIGKIVGTGVTVTDGVVVDGVVVQPATSSTQTVITRIAIFFTVSPSLELNCGIKVNHPGKKSL